MGRNNGLILPPIAQSWLIHSQTPISVISITEFTNHGIHKERHTPKAVAMGPLVKRGSESLKVHQKYNTLR